MCKALAERVYRKHKDSIFGVVLTKHFFERFYERSDDLSELLKLLRVINKRLPEIIFDLTLSGDHKVIEIDGYRLPCILQVNETLVCPQVVVKTMYK
jgi:hypothetical protein